MFRTSSLRSACSVSNTLIRASRSLKNLQLNWLGPQWHGFIKEYDGGTLMECLIHDRMPYTRFPEMIRAQRFALDTRIRKLSKSHLVYPGLTCFKTEQRAMLRPADIPGGRNVLQHVSL